MPVGTVISVKNLFYNTPARRNFLRADTTEFNHILKVLRRFFLAYPEIKFTLIHNGEELYQLAAATLDERIVQVFGEKFYKGMVSVREELNQIQVEGFVSRPDFGRGNSEHQYLFLNKRAIQSRSLAHAVLQGYGNLLERNRYPQFILFLTIPPHQVDVNVHPTKMEARFSNERAIYHLFLTLVRRAIQTPGFVPEMQMNSDRPEHREIRRHFQQFRRSGKPSAIQTLGPSPEPAANQLTINYTLPESPAPPALTLEPPPAAPEGHTQATLWQVHNRYILAQVNSGLVIIDQHVAHERILFERVLAYLENEHRAPSQQLLFPQTLDLSLEDYLMYSDLKTWLEKIGFSITELSGRTILIEAIPADVKVGYEGKILLEILDYYRENEDKKYTPNEKIAAAFACKNAIKSGEKLSQEAMNSLVDQLFATREPFFCPHGRQFLAQ
ncbi:hypothetical protein D6833_05670, partial [Candidatus Parcubacteria bacterium]